MQVIPLKCPNCGATVDTQQRNCKYCKSPIIITSFNSVYSMPTPLVSTYANTYKGALTEDPGNPDLNASIAMCFLKLKMYDKAIEGFEKAVVENFDNSELFFFEAVALLRGRKAFSTAMSDIKRALELVNAATMIEPRGVYYYFSAYLKYDYYERKYLNISPNYSQDLKKAKENNLTFEDARILFELIEQQTPEVLRL